jgi:hypothetical protein
MVAISRLGQKDATAPDYDLFLKVFGGEVLTTFQESNLLMDKQMVRTIQSGKSAQFPVLGTASTKYAAPGESLVEDTGYLSQIKHNEKIISVDQFLTSSVMIADADELMNHYDVRSSYATMIGRALAKQMDINIIGALYGAAKTATGDVDKPSGTLITGGSATDIDAIKTKAFAAAQALDENDCPSEDRFLLVKPAAYYALTQDTTVLDRDFSEHAGDFAEGRVYKIAGLSILKTNNMPTSAAIAAAPVTGINNDMFGADTDYLDTDWTGVHQLAFHKSAVGTVKLADLSVESEYQLERLATLMVAKYMCGHGILRPESAVAITT